MDFPPAPTPAELLSLSALVARTAPPRTDLRALLDDLLRHVRSPKVLDFLFSPEPLHLAPLLSAALPDSAFTFHTSTTRVAPPPPVFPHPPDPYSASHHMSSSILLAPVCLLPPLCTLGVGVMHTVQLMGETVLPLAMVSSQTSSLNFRFLFDPLTRTTLMVYDAPADDRIAIYICTNASLTTMHSTTISFTRSTLLHLIRTKHAALTSDDLSSAMECLFRDYNERLCPLCNSPPSPNTCNCVIPLALPAHPADFSFFKANQLAYFGAYHGISHRTFRLPSELHQATLGTRFTMKAVRDDGLIDRLRAWAISTYFQAVPDNPLESVAFARSPSSSLSPSLPSPVLLPPDHHVHARVARGPAAAAFPGVGGGGGGVGHHYSHFDHHHDHHHDLHHNCYGLEDHVQQRHDSAGTVSVHLEELLAEIAGDGTQGAIRADEFGGGGGCTPVSMTSSGRDGGDEAWRLRVASGWQGQAPTGGVPFEAGGAPKGGLSTETSTIHSESEGSLTKRQRGSDAWEAGRERAALPAHAAHAAHAEDVGSGVSGGEADAVRGAVGGAEAGAADNGAGGRGVAAATDDVHEILRRIKDEERRERNRISARRSNRKKKERGVALERELGRMRTLKQQLQAREGQLRAENGALRGGLARAQEG